VKKGHPLGKIVQREPIGEVLTADGNCGPRKEGKILDSFKKGKGGKVRGASHLGRKAKETGEGKDPPLSIVQGTSRAGSALKQITATSERLGKSQQRNDEEEKGKIRDGG